ncbi:MAG: hypothetical protein ACR2FE_10510 [Aeromicrobium sp.]
MFSAWPQDEFRDGVNAESARDTYAALCNIDAFRVLTEERGWDAERVEQWWIESLVRLLAGHLSAVALPYSALPSDSPPGVSARRPHCPARAITDPAGRARGGVVRRAVVPGFGGCLGSQE